MRKCTGSAALRLAPTATLSSPTTITLDTSRPTKMALTRSVRLARMGEVLALASNGFALAVDDATDAMLCVRCLPVPATPVKADCAPNGEGDPGTLELGDAVSAPN